MLKLGSIADDKIHLASIDGLRGIAVLMVLAVHTSQRVGNVATGSFNSSIVEQFINAGARGVQLFFLLSAFTLFRSSKIKFDREISPRRNFYIRRAFRILPLWWLVTALYTVLGNNDFAASLPSFLMYFGFIRYSPGVDIFPLGWSIFAEETFYLLLPLIFGFVTCIRRACMFFVALLALSLLWRVLAGSFGVPNENDFIFLFPLSHWFCFGLGILLFLIYEKKSWRALLNDARMAWMFDITAILALFVLLRTKYILASFGLAYVFIVSLSNSTLFGKIARSALLTRFGICCYSIYLLQFATLDYTDSFKDWLLGWMGVKGSSVEVRFLMWFPMVAFLNLTLGMVVFRFIEKPCVELGKKVIQSLERHPSAVTAE